MDMVRKPPGNAHETRRARAIMSGPKTSDLDVERQTQERLQRARDRITAAEADALRQIENLEAELRAYAKAHEGLGDTSNALERIVAEAIESVHAAAHFTMGGSVDAADTDATVLEKISESWIDNVKIYGWMGYTAEMILSQYTFQQSREIQETLEPNSKYYIYAFAVDDEALRCSDIVFIPITTNDTSIQH